MTQKLLLTLNAGSSSVKIGIFTADAVRLASGLIDFRKPPLRLQLHEGPAELDIALHAPPEDAVAVVAETFDWLARHFEIDRLVAIGHRVVHGGAGFAGPVRLDDAALATIEALTPNAPLHQPQSLRLIRAVAALRPEVVQTASFDTAFHRTQSELVSRFAIPRALHEAGIRRYGFHGLSYASIAASLARDVPALARGKVVVAHLGSGASLCALEGGRSRDSSMGFSTLDGIPMATRCGALDAGVLLHLLGPGGQSLGQVEDLLYHRSGLLGVSGISADSRVLLDSPAPEAREAIELFTFRIAGEVARLAATLGGLDALVFTAGIGENQPRIRAAVCSRLAWLGLALDPAANDANAPRISTVASRVAALVIRTDEERVVAEEALAVLAADRPGVP
ncbi:acetate/propionate family kinase [Falsiroseomonas sp.]|uniref:acetate/propionate family kinase n=1 Tax=Falsiroseomonas sp. TaxID=2870721 RepID=UPI002723D030|nr:acetate/propionate family kinase [Falsiroseomonas sp.]MDO9502396.1 acetate/propionate family kinase [Falsiroseomonas sp.]